MANVNRVNGFRPVSTLSGSSWQGAIRTYECSASAENIFPGDLIAMQSDGTVAAAAAGGVELIGVCVGVTDWMPSRVSGKNDNFITSGSTPDLSKRYHAKGTKGTILVVVGPDILYEAQEDGDTSTLALGDIGSNVDMIAGTGNTTSGASAQQLDSSTVATTSAQLRLVEFCNRPDNTLGSAYARWIVRINENHFTKLAGI